MQSSTPSDSYEEEEDAPANTQKPDAFISKVHDVGKMLKRRFSIRHSSSSLDGDKMQRTAMQSPSTLDIDLARDGELVALRINEALTSLKTCGLRHPSYPRPTMLVKCSNAESTFTGIRV